MDATRGPSEGIRAAADLVKIGGCELARLIADRAVTSEEVVSAHIRRIELISPKINAVSIRRFEHALEESRRADQMVLTDELLPPLHGVPISVKQTIDVAGLPTEWGTTGSIAAAAAADAAAVQRLRRAGAIVLVKTSVPQLAFYYETDNPVLGCTHNPWNTDRTCGGSSGGEAALIAAGGSPLGLATDLGGSIRVPAHFCGIQSLMPTPAAVSTSGVLCLGLGHALDLSVGPMARHVEDVIRAYECLADGATPSIGTSVTPTQTPRHPQLSELRMAALVSDSYFPPSPAIRRAVEQAAQSMADRGATLVDMEWPSCREVIELYVSLLSADGGAEMRRALEGSRRDPRIGKLLRLAGLPSAARRVIADLADWKQQAIEAHLLRVSRRRTCDEYWQLTNALNRFRNEFHQRMDRAAVDAVLLPPFGLAAVPHGRSMDLLAAGCYAMLPNLLGLPTGVVSLTRVKAGEESDRASAADRVVRLAARCEQGTAGLPVGVQIMGRAWREDVVMAIMLSLESQFSDHPDYPARQLPEIG